MILRPHQIAAVDAVVEDLALHRSTLIVHPTGTGKSVTAASLIKLWIDQGLRVLVICPAHLVDQFADHAVRAAGPLGVTIEQGDRVAGTGSRVVVASVPTLRGHRLERYPVDHFDRIIIDEAHHAKSATWIAAVSRFVNAKIVGLTATPDRADGCSLMGELFDSVAHQYTIRDAIRDGFLVPIRYTAVTLDGVDLSKIRTQRGDYASAQLGRELIRAETATDTIVERSIALVGDRKAVVFAVTIEHANVLADAYRKAGRTAVAVSSKTPAHERAASERDFEAGEIQYLVNVGCYCEGWDHPPVSAIVLARPTKSRSLYTQQIGRGLRLSPGKADCVIVDFAGGSDRHSLVHPYDVLIPGLSSDARDILEELSADTELTEAVLELALAEAELRVEHRQREIDVLAAKKLTEDQIEDLVDLGVDATRARDTLDRATAGVVIDLLHARRAEGLVSVKQLRRLTIAGTHPVDALALSGDRARAGIAQLADNGWRRPWAWGKATREPSPVAIARVPRVVRDLLVPLIAST